VTGRNTVMQMMRHALLSHSEWMTHSGWRSRLGHWNFTLLCNITFFAC